MPRFLIEVPHDSDQFACARVVRTFLETGSHYLTHADWGCEDGEHKAWLIVEAADRKEAAMLVPPPLRAHATVVRLGRFTPEDVDAMLEQHRE
jgi:hypothetical protein